MDHRRLLVASFLLFAFVQLSFRWPLDNPKLTSTFAESRWDHFHDGVDITAVEKKVFPVEPGKFLFAWDKALFPLDTYPGGGNYVILKHANGYDSIYMHLKDGIPLKDTYNGTEPLALVGNTGHSFSDHLHFSIINHRDWRSLNPLGFMPPMVDPLIPTIMELAFRIGEKYVIVHDLAAIRLTKNYPLLVKIVDSFAGNEKLGIYKLDVYHNEKKILNVVFDSIAVRKEGLCIQGRRFDQLYDENGYYKVEGITYTPGPNTFTVTATDFNGNIAEKKFTLDIMLDMK